MKLIIFNEYFTTTHFELFYKELKHFKSVLKSTLVNEIVTNNVFGVDQLINLGFI